MPKTTSPSRKDIGFVPLLLASGFCGISYEILYGRVLGNLIGDQFAVSSAVLLTFLLGIGFGTLHAHRLWRHLWAIEAGIGACGVVFAVGTKPLDALLYVAGGWFGHGMVANVFMCLLLLSIPSFLIGCSLPLFAGYLSRVSSGRVFSRAYMIYNFGAAITALLIEFWLLRVLGIRGTMLAIAGLNFAVAVALRLGYDAVRAQVPAASERSVFPREHVIALGIVSVASAIFQLLMVKLAECVLGPFRETFALVLSVVFLGIALGSALAGRYRISFANLLLINAGGVAWLIACFGWMARLYTTNYASASEDYLSSVLLKLALIVGSMAVPAVTFGATIPALLQEQKNVARESGHLLFISSIANALGFVLMAFGLHRLLDYGALIVLVGLMVIASILVFYRFRGSSWLAAAGAAAGLLILHRTAWNEDLLYAGHTAFHSPEDLKTSLGRMNSPERFKGFQDTFSINRNGGNAYFFINGYVSFRLNAPYEKLVGAYASLYAPRTDKALVLGLGSGATGGSVCLLFDKIDAVEINPTVAQNLFRMKEWNFDIESFRPKLTIHVDDAIHYTKSSQEKYSLVVNTVTTPLYFSSSKLYTKDFFEAVRARLTDDGVYMTWVDSRVGDKGLNIILKSLQQVFPECSLGCIQSTYYLVLCSQKPLRAHNAQKVAENPHLTDFLWKQNGLRTDWMPYGLLTTKAYDTVKGIEAPVNTLDFPALEFECARLRKRGIDDFKRRIQAHLNLADVQEALSSIMKFDPVDFTVYHDVLHGSSIARRWREVVAESVPEFDEKFKAAKASYVAARASFSNNADTFHDAGMELLRAGQYAAAIEEFSKALVRNPKRNNSHFNIGSCYERLGKYESALAEYQAELAVDPTDEDVPFRIGRTQYRLKRYAEAIDSLTLALEKAPGGSVYYYRGITYAALGNAASARTDLNKARSLKYDDEAVTRALDELRATDRP